MSTKTRFEEEAKGNSEMAYFLGLFFKMALSWCPRPLNGGFRWQVLQPGLQLLGKTMVSKFELAL